LFKIIVSIFIFSISLFSYETENILKVVIVGKVAKYITFPEKASKEFVITVYKNRCGTLFDDTYRNIKIKNKPVKINYIDNIDNIDNLGYTDILYISKITSSKLSEILKKTNNKDILTISDNRGFAEKGGVIQIYFVSQQLKLKINTQVATNKNLKIEPILLRIADIVKGNQ